MADPVDVISRLEGLTGFSLSGAQGDTRGAGLIMGFLQSNDLNGRSLMAASELAFTHWREQFGNTGFADKILEQLQAVNGGEALPENITNRIRTLLESPDAQTFATSVAQMQQEHQTYLRAIRAATTDEERQAVPVSFVATLINASQSLTAFAGNNLNTSPAAQVDAHEQSAFSRIFDFNVIGNDGGSNYAMLAGLPFDQWGTYDESTGGYSGFQNEAYAINSALPVADAWSQTPIPVFSGPQNPDEMRAFWSDSDKVQAFITVHLERRGIVEFDNDAQRLMWNEAMGEAFTGDEPVRNAEQLMERMRELAQEHEGIKLMSENEGNTLYFEPSDTTKYFYRTVQAQGLVNFTAADNDDRHAFLVAAEDVLNEATDQGLDYYQIMQRLEEELEGHSKIEFNQVRIAQTAIDLGYREVVHGNLIPPVSDYDQNGTPIETVDASRVTDGTFTVTSTSVPVRAVEADPSLIQMASVAEVGVGLRSQPELGMDPNIQPRDPGVEMRIG